MNEWLELDRDLLLAVNEWHTAFGDAFMWTVSWKFTWIPLYILIFIIWVRRYGWKKASVAGLMIVPLIILTDQISSNVFKPEFARLRPCHEADLRPILHLINNKCGGQYGFVSSHAANFFGMAVYLGSFFSRPWQILGFLLAGLTGFSRVYLNVHYPGDVVGGMLLGLAAGGLILFIFRQWIAPTIHFPQDLK